jgi:hypothetical protein
VGRTGTDRKITGEPWLSTLGQRNMTKENTLRSGCRSLSTKDLTEPTLLEMYDRALIRHVVSKSGETLMLHRTHRIRRSGTRSCISARCGRGPRGGRESDDDRCGTRFPRHEGYARARQLTSGKRNRSNAVIPSTVVAVATSPPSKPNAPPVKIGGPSNLKTLQPLSIA